MMSDSIGHDVPKSRRPPRYARNIGLGLVIGIVALVLLTCIGWFTMDTRQSAVRAQKHGLLYSVKQAAEARQAHTAAAAVTLDGLLAAGYLHPDAVRDFSPVDLLPGGDAPTGPVPMVVQNVPCRAVRKGERWGGIEETIDHDLPACRFVLMSDWTVVQIDEPDYQRDWAGRVKPKAWK